MWNLRIAARWMWACGGGADLWKTLGLDQKILLAGATAMICLGIISLAARNMWINFWVILAAFGWCAYVMRGIASSLKGKEKRQALRIMRPALIVCGLALVGIMAWMAAGWLLS